MCKSPSGGKWRVGFEEGSIGEFVFFFSSRRRHTRLQGDWSSDVCSSDLVDDVDLSIREGEFLVLLGPSGCGKTTLLRMIAGLERPTAGEIHIGGERMDDAPPRAPGIAMGFQSYALYPHRTASRNISFPLQALRLARRAIDGKGRWAAAM